MRSRLLILLAVLIQVGVEAQTRAGENTNDAKILAPQGTLRAAFLGGNPSLGRVDKQTGVVTGPVADMVKELARQLAVPYQLIPAADARDIIGRLQAHTADLGFMAFNAGRAEEVDFSHAWLMMPNSYVVLRESPIQKVSDADQAGLLLGAVKNDTQDVWLSANLKNAKVKQVPALPSVPEIQRMLESKEIVAFAANRQRLIEAVSNRPQLRVVADNFSVAGQSVAVPKTSAGALDAINRRVDGILSTSLVKNSIEKAGLKGVDAALP